MEKERRDVVCLGEFEVEFDSSSCSCSSVSLGRGMGLETMAKELTWYV